MLLDEIEITFSNPVYPGDNALADEYPNEWESMLRQLQGKDWRTVVTSDFDSQGGIIEGVQSLGLKGFIYFLPGLVRLALTRVEDRYCIASALLTRFVQLDLREFSSDHPPEFQQRLLAALSSEQREFMARFFTSMQKADPLICPVVIESAIANLADGKVAPYRIEDVKKWYEKQNTNRGRRGQR